MIEESPIVIILVYNVVSGINRPEVLIRIGNFPEGSFSSYNNAWPGNQRSRVASYAAIRAEYLNGTRLPCIGRERFAIRQFNLITDLGFSPEFHCDTLLNMANICLSDV